MKEGNKGKKEGMNNKEASKDEGRKQAGWKERK